MYRPLIWGKFDPKTEIRLHPSIIVLDEQSIDENDNTIDDKKEDTSKQSSSIVVDEVNINEVQIVVNEGYHDDSD